MADLTPSQLSAAALLANVARTVDPNSPFPLQRPGEALDGNQLLASLIALAEFAKTADSDTLCKVAVAGLAVKPSAQQVTPLSESKVAAGTEHSFYLHRIGFLYDVVNRVLNMVNNDSSDLYTLFKTKIDALNVSIRKTYDLANDLMAINDVKMRIRQDVMLLNSVIVLMEEHRDVFGNEVINLANNAKEETECIIA